MYVGFHSLHSTQPPSVPGGSLLPGRSCLRAGPEGHGAVERRAPESPVKGWG